MDPTATWILLSDAVKEEDWDLAVHHAENLMTWMNGNGFPPRITGVTNFDLIVARKTCEAIMCWEVL